MKERGSARQHLTGRLQRLHASEGGAKNRKQRTTTGGTCVVVVFLSLKSGIFFFFLFSFVIFLFFYGLPHKLYTTFRTCLKGYLVCKPDRVGLEPESIRIHLSPEL